MKKIALLLVLVLCLSSLTGVAAVAEGEAPAEAPSLDIALYTVPMKATVSILYAVEAAGYESVDGLKVVVTKGESSEEVLPAGVMTIDGVEYIIFEYEGLSAAEMRTTVSAHVEFGGESGASVEYSVAKFAENYKGAHIDLVAAMLAYGDAVAAMMAAKAAE